MTIKAVFLDVDDTLIDYQHAARTAFHAALGAEADYDSFFGLDHYERFLSGELGFAEARDSRMADFLVSIGRDSDAPRAADIEQQRFAQLEHHYVLFADARPCLDDLRARGLRIGLITNNEPVHQRAKIAAVGLDRLVDIAVISGDLPFAKPDRRIFARACELLDVAPGEALHVGDNPVADAQGAHDAGLRAALLDRSGSHDPGSYPFAVIPALDRVAGLLDAA